MGPILVYYISGVLRAWYYGFNVKNISIYWLNTLYEDILAFLSYQIPYLTLDTWPTIAVITIIFYESISSVWSGQKVHILFFYRFVIWLLLIMADYHYAIKVILCWFSFFIIVIIFLDQSLDERGVIHNLDLNLIIEFICGKII